MYAALWRILPGPVWLRIVELLILLFIVLTVLTLWVFPWVNEYVSLTEEGTVSV